MSVLDARARPRTATSSRAQPVELRSYRAVFELEYRVYRVQRWALPLANGIALSTICWTLATALAIVLAEPLPLLGDALGLLPDPLRYVVAPALVGVVMSRYRPDGRPLHQFAAAALRHRLATGSLDAFAPVRPTQPVERFVEGISLRCDPSAPAYRPGRLRGPAIVALRGQAEVRNRRDGIELLPRPGRLSARPVWLQLRAGQTLQIRASRRR